jgi:hypothetical protein
VLVAESLGEYISIEAVDRFRALMGNIHEICIESVVAWNKVYPSSIHDIISYHLFFSIVLSKTMDSNLYLLPITSLAQPTPSASNTMTSPLHTLNRTASPGKQRHMIGSRSVAEVASSNASPAIGYMLTEVSASILDANLKFLHEVKAAYEKIKLAQKTEVESEADPSQQGHPPKQILRLRKPTPFTPKSMYKSIITSAQPSIRISADSNTSARALIPMIENLSSTDSDLLLLTGEYLNQFSSFLTMKAPDLRLTIQQRLKTLLRQQPLLQKAPLLLHIQKNL